MEEGGFGGVCSQGPVEHFLDIRSFFQLPSSPKSSEQMRKTWETLLPRKAPTYFLIFKYFLGDSIVLANLTSSKSKVSLPVTTSKHCHSICKILLCSAPQKISQSTRSRFWFDKTSFFFKLLKFQKPMTFLLVHTLK